VRAATGKLLIHTGGALLVVVAFGLGAALAGARFANERPAMGVMSARSTRLVPATDTAGGCPRGKTMNIVAHEDDDLLFLSPDLLRDGAPAGACEQSL
jgi:hypothetical protein